MKIQNLTIIELLDVFNKIVEGVKTTSINPPEVRGEMVRQIQKTFGKKHIIRSHTRDETFKLKVGVAEFTFGVSIKKTGKLKMVTKLRKKEFVRPGKVSFKHITAEINFPAFETTKKPGVLTSEWTTYSGGFGVYNNGEKIGSIISLAYIERCWLESNDGVVDWFRNAAWLKYTFYKPGDHLWEYIKFYASLCANQLNPNINYLEDSKEIFPEHASKITNDETRRQVLKEIFDETNKELYEKKYEEVIKQIEMIN